MLASLRRQVGLVLACRPCTGVRKETQRSFTCSDLQLSTSSALDIRCWEEVLLLQLLGARDVEDELARVSGPPTSSRHNYITI